MAAAVNITDSDSRITAKVTKFGQLVVAPLAYSTPVVDTLNVINTAFNFIKPQQDHRIVITDIVISADRAVGVNGADVQIYEAETAETTTIDTTILDLDMVKQTQLGLTGLNLLVPEGKFVNAKTDDVNILVTIMFYRVPAEDV